MLHMQSPGWKTSFRETGVFFQFYFSVLQMDLKVVQGSVSHNNSIYIVTRGKMSRLALVSNLVEIIDIKYYLIELKYNNMCLIMFRGWSVCRRMIMKV